jgi:gamma-glutamyl hydrolase
MVRYGVFLLLSFAGIVVSVETIPLTNTRPVIGILSTPKYFATFDGGVEPGSNPDLSFIPASYVKLVESAGARVVPVSMNLPDAELRTLLDKLNGIYLTGGVLPPGHPSFARYYQKTQVIIDVVKEKFDAGVHFPLWGTCLGFEVILDLINGSNTLEDVDGWDN